MADLRDAAVDLIAYIDDIWEPEHFDLERLRYWNNKLRAALSADAAATIAAAGKPEWMLIDSAPKDGTPILLGHWFDDTHGGYFGEPRWLWRSSGSIDEEGIWLDVLDDHIEPANFHTVTHWAPLLAPPLPPSFSPEDQEKAKAAATPTIADPDGESGR